MKKKITSKKKVAVLLTAIILLVVLFSAGIVYAWFSSTIKSQDNRIDAGNLKIKLYQSYDGTDYDDDISVATEDNELFNFDNWAPGNEATVYLKIANEGSLDAQYYVAISKLESTRGQTATADLEDAIDVYINGNNIGALSDFNRSKTQSLLSGTLDAYETDDSNPDSSVTFTLGLKFSESAEIKYMGGNIEKFDIVVKAAQTNDSSFNRLPAANPVVETP